MHSAALHVHVSPAYTETSAHQHTRIITLCVSTSTRSLASDALSECAAMSNALGWMLPPGVRYLWTLPMFHCNGWTFPWALAAVGGTSVCLRKVTAKGMSVPLLPPPRAPSPRHCCWRFQLAWAVPAWTRG